MSASTTFTTVCGDCRQPIHQQSEQALSGEMETVWAIDGSDQWVCDVTGDEHRMVHVRLSRCDEQTLSGDVCDTLLAERGECPRADRHV